ncbi:hypothetical protein P154DRAFT_549536 [Amniculicola lignicola CBS 123094]|uniref:CCHC-type domain-containing protein n=1 Tax=Amniculicola lignicola CBS 123094 TaxID=1392246 RepID=A0A6A5VVE1_9PLEO|nr:hypothetical protein P154DRAFT_549536 [Amniculicola lignicola CBS 123094]
MASPNAPKALSINLMGMKFMQRAAAKNPNSQPSTPNGPPAKRARLSNGRSAPGTPATPSDHELIQAALAAEETKREVALEKAAEQAGDSKWYLNFSEPHPAPKDEKLEVAYAGYAEIDADTDSSDEEGESAAPKSVRMVFGGGVKWKPVIDDVQQKPAACSLNQERPAYMNDESDEDEDSSESDDYDLDDPAAGLIRETKRQKKREARLAQKESEAREKSTPKRRIHEDSDLSGLTTLSGGGKAPGGGITKMDCHLCGQKGHLMRSCPNKEKNIRGSKGRGGRAGGGAACRR